MSKLEIDQSRPAWPLPDHRKTRENCTLTIHVQSCETKTAQNVRCLITYSQIRKIMNTVNLSGMLWCCKKKANQACETELQECY